MDTNDYASMLEMKMVDKFKQEFFAKFEYYPIVLTNSNMVSHVEDSIKKLISLEELKTYFDPFLPKYMGKTVTLEMSRRIREANELRVIYAYIARSMSYCYKEIGESLGGRDHTTIMNAINNFNTWIEIDPKFLQLYLKVSKYIKTKNEKLKIYEPPTMENMPEVQHQS